MSKRGRSRREDSAKELEVKLLFKEIDENNLFIAASLAYFFGVLYALLTSEVETYFGIILLLTAIMIIWYFKDRGKEIRRKCEKQIESLRNNRRT